MDEPAEPVPAANRCLGSRAERDYHDCDAAVDEMVGRMLAVDGLRFGVRPGAVTGLLGPKGAGMSIARRPECGG
jgi:ABC-type glutathione transport system ATPase component